jgi:hypothetical protein
MLFENMAAGRREGKRPAVSDVVVDRMATITM